MKKIILISLLLFVTLMFSFSNSLELLKPNAFVYKENDDIKSAGNLYASDGFKITITKDLQKIIADYPDVIDLFEKSKKLSITGSVFYGIGIGSFFALAYTPLFPVLHVLKYDTLSNFKWGNFEATMTYVYTIVFAPMAIVGLIVGFVCLFMSRKKIEKAFELYNKIQREIISFMMNTSEDKIGIGLNIKIKNKY